jgi:hypothetical protein
MMLAKKVGQMEIAEVFAEIDFQKGLINSHALFSPSKKDNSLKFEPVADQLLNGAGHETFTRDEFSMFCRPCAVNL